MGVVCTAEEKLNINTENIDNENIIPEQNQLTLNPKSSTIADKKSLKSLHTDMLLRQEKLKALQNYDRKAQSTKVDENTSFVLSKEDTVKEDISLSKHDKNNKELINDITKDYITNERKIDKKESTFKLESHKTGETLSSINITNKNFNSNHKKEVQDNKAIVFDINKVPINPESLVYPNNKNGKYRKCDCILPNKNLMIRLRNKGHAVRIMAEYNRKLLERQNRKKKNEEKRKILELEEVDIKLDKI